MYNKHKNLFIFGYNRDANIDMTSKIQQCKVQSWRSLHFYFKTAENPCMEQRSDLLQAARWPPVCILGLFFGMKKRM